MAKRNRKVPTGPQRYTASEKRAQAVRLRKAGLTFREIGEQLGVSGKTAHDYVRQSLEALNAQTQEDIAEYRALQSARLEQAVRAIWPNVLQGHLGAVDRLIRISAEHSKLFGLYSPVKVAPTDPTGAESWQGGGLSALLRKVQGDDGGSDNP